MPTPYPQLEEHLYPNAPDPILGEVGALELKTAMAFERDEVRHGPKITSSRAVASVVRDEGEPGDLIVIPLSSKNHTLNTLVRTEASSPLQDLVASAAASLLSGGVAMVLVRRVEAMDPDELARDPLLDALKLHREHLGIDMLDLVQVPDEGPYLSALDLGLL